MSWRTRRLRSEVEVSIVCFEISDSSDGSLAGMVSVSGPNLHQSGICKVEWISEPGAGGRVTLIFPDSAGYDSIVVDVREFDDSPERCGAKAYPQQVRRWWKGAAYLRAMPEASIHG